MSTQWPGGIISKTAPTITAPTGGEGGSTSGMWTLPEVMVHEKAGNWPKGVFLRELWGFGSNTVGQLGTGNTTDATTAVQIGSESYWAAIAAGLQHSCGIKTDGTLWTWGEGASGRLGLGSTTDYSSPVQVGDLTDWLSIATGAYHMVSVKTDGTLWTWGLNSNGQLGDGSTTVRSSPVQIGSLTTWLSLSAGQYASPLVTQTNGTLWSWGYNPNGEIGTGNTTNYSSPVQIGSLTTWNRVSKGWFWSMATTKSNALYSWGYNVSGQLGHGNTTALSSPVQVGSLTTWLEMAGGGDQGLALKQP